jgi:hypothetical protein
VRDETWGREWGEIVRSLRRMRIGDEVTYDGRRYVVVGFTPFSVKPYKVELFSAERKESLWVEWPAEQTLERAALQLAPEENTKPAE